MSFDELYYTKYKRFLGSHANPQKIIEEITEHMVLYKQVIFYILGPLFFFYIGSSIFLGDYSGGAALFALLVSFYSSFLPEADLMLAPKGYLARKGRLAKPYEKYLVLFLAPLYLYLAATRRLQPVFCNEFKPLHTMKALFAYSLFLMLVGLLLYASFFKTLFFALFGAIGYATHLLVDKVT